jgi:hypothetical protein
MGQLDLDRFVPGYVVDTAFVVPFYIQLTFNSSIDVVRRRCDLRGRTLHGRNLSNLAVR